jgi:hypothetical protein
MDRQEDFLGVFQKTLGVLPFLAVNSNNSNDSQEQP